MTSGQLPDIPRQAETAVKFTTLYVHSKA